MPSLLDEVRNYLGPPPRKQFAPGKTTYDHVLPAPWFARSDELYEIYLKQDMLIREGAVVWGAIVQSNRFLLQPGRNDHPATVIWCENQEIETKPELLLELAGRLFDLKGAKPVDHEERRYAAMLSDESR